MGLAHNSDGMAPADDVGLKMIKMLVNLLKQRLRDPDEFGQNTIGSNFFVFQSYLKSLKPEINYGRNVHFCYFLEKFERINFLC